MEAGDPRLIELVEAVRRLEYGRPSERTVEAMLAEGRGTCSLKHLHLSRVLEEEFPQCGPRIVHRVHRVDRDGARRLFGEAVSGAVPEEGLVDVHRYLTVEIGGRRTVVDATFPGPVWDGASDMTLACGAGVDHPSEGDPDGEKRELEARHCDAAARERFVAALARAV